jgi:hypothetical protein
LTLILAIDNSMPMPFRRKLDVLDRAAVRSFMSVLDTPELEALATAVSEDTSAGYSWLREEIAAEQRRRWTSVVARPTSNAVRATV